MFARALTILSLLPVVGCGSSPAPGPALPPSAPTEQVPASSKLAPPPEGMPFVHPIFSEHAVLQQGRPIPVWGWTNPGAEVRVEIAGASAVTTAGADGTWRVELGPLPAGGPHTLLVEGRERVEVPNVQVGEVWLCSGQSNMEWNVATSKDAEKEIASANDPDLSLLTAPRAIRPEPEPLQRLEWTTTSPTSVGKFSAVCYYFGRELRNKLKVPVGLVHSSWGGTPIRSWMSAEALMAQPETAMQLTGYRNMRRELERGTQFEEIVSKWWAEHDPGTQNGAHAEDFDDERWKKMKLPSNWEDRGLPDYDGVAWFRTTVRIAKADAGKKATLSLGPIDDRDTTFLNGKPLGSGNVWNAPRVYDVPAGLLHEGPNTIAVRVLDTGGGGGFHGTPKQMSLALEGGKSISLAGEWRYTATASADAVPVPPNKPENDPNEVGVLYNGMIAPLVPFALAGALWYQGESDAWQAELYRRTLPTMISDWRRKFDYDLEFLIVQLASFQPLQKEPSEGGWALLREAQFLTAKRVPNTGLVVTTDIGDANDIHPRNKQDVGARLALWALGTKYGQKLTYSGPLYKGMRVDGKSIRVSFDHVGSGLAIGQGNELKGFAIAGADGKFVWAKASIDGAEVVVSSPRVKAPTVVRYNWANNPVGNLTNQAGLPASSFRSDEPE